MSQSHGIQKYYFLHSYRSSSLTLQGLVMLQCKKNNNLAWLQIKSTNTRLHKWKDTKECLMPHSVWSQQQHKCQSWCLGGMCMDQTFWITKYSRLLPVHQCWTTITLVKANEGTADALQIIGLSLWDVTVPTLNIAFNLWSAGSEHLQAGSFFPFRSIPPSGL